MMVKRRYIVEREFIAWRPKLIFYTMMEEVIHFHGVAVLKTA